MRRLLHTPAVYTGYSDRVFLPFWRQLVPRLRHLKIRRPQAPNNQTESTFHRHALWIQRTIQPFGCSTVMSLHTNLQRACLQIDRMKPTRRGVAPARHCSLSVRQDQRCWVALSMLTGCALKPMTWWRCPTSRRGVKAGAPPRRAVELHENSSGPSNARSPMMVSTTSETFTKRSRGHALPIFSPTWVPMKIRGKPIAPIKRPTAASP